MRNKSEVEARARERALFKQLEDQATLLDQWSRKQMWRQKELTEGDKAKVQSILEGINKSVGEAEQLVEEHRKDFAGHDKQTFDSLEIKLNAAKASLEAKPNNKLNNLAPSESGTLPLRGLNDAVQAVRDLAGGLRQTHLMSAKEFQASTSVPYRRRPPNMRRIDNILGQLEESGPKSRFSLFQKKPIRWLDPVPGTPIRGGRLDRMKELYDIISAEIGVINDAQASKTYAPKNKAADNIRKAGLEKLSVQLKYQLNKQGVAVDAPENKNELQGRERKPR
ncbi:MAG: hypothetical protein K0S27_141 [Gammaproteobacteria bacterium]|jgi:hypothetical protein|nr:hypothetical protein [Gammaproteobacteria bacterium]